MEKILLIFRYKDRTIWYGATPEAVLSSNIFLIPDFPILLITINNMFFFCLL